MEINETYYWYAFNNDGKTNVSSFTTNTYAPRSLYINGITNARDLGGYATSDGNYTNQGMIYRTSRFNENETTDLLITETGIDEMVNRLNIKSELDNRRVDNNENGGLTTSPLGSEEDLYKDYLYSNFANIGRSRSPSTIKDYLTLINSSNGESLAEKTKNYLIDVGVDEEDINVLIDMMK